MASKTRLLQINGIEINVRIEGHGPPVLLIHGFPDSLTVWQSVTPLLVAGGYRVIAFDLRGFGKSELVQGVQNYRINCLVTDIAALLEALNIDDPLHVMGHDWGSAIAWCFALAHPERVRSLVALSVGHPQAYGRAGLEQKISKGLYVLGFQFRGLAEAWLLRNHAAGLRSWGSSHPNLEEAVNDMSRPGRLTAGLSLYRANLFQILFGRWPRGKVPTLGIWSSGDRYLTEQQMLDSASLVDSEWHYYRIENCGHWMPLEQPGLVAENAMDWFGRH